MMSILVSLKTKKIFFVTSERYVNMYKFWINKTNHFYKELSTVRVLNGVKGH
jgi:hypothetical protein